MYFKRIVISEKFHANYKNPLNNTNKKYKNVSLYKINKTQLIKHTKKIGSLKTDCAPGYIQQFLDSKN